MDEGAGGLHARHAGWIAGRAALVKRIAQLDDSQPAKVEGLQIVAGRYYTLRTPSGAQSPKLYVRDGVKGADRLLIDPEKIPGNDKSHYSIHDYRPSPDGRHIACQLAAGGSEESVLHVFDVDAGKDLPQAVDRIDGDISAPFWLADSRSFFYSRELKFDPGTPAAKMRENKPVYLHVLGRSFDADPPVFGHGVSDTTVAMTPGEFPEIVAAPGSRYAIAFISPGSDARLRVYAAPVHTIESGRARWRPIAASYDDQYIGSDNSDHPVIALTGNTLYWLSRKNASRGEILKLDLSRADSKPEVVVPQGDLPISAVYSGRDAIYWRVSDAGINGIHRLSFAANAKPEPLRLPYPADIAEVDTDPLSGAAMMLAMSWLRSPAYLGASPRSSDVAVTDLQAAGPFDQPGNLVAEEVKVKSWDGAEVPLSIIHREGLKLDGSNPTWLGGYGAYGISVPPLFPLALFSWYERGGVFAIAHARGGGEYGEPWHKAGFQATKVNTWKDFIACAEYLVGHRYTNPQKLVGFGGSAGGIMIGRAIEERPDLFAVAVIDVPAADMLRFETTATGPDNIPEFGSVKTEAGFKALYAMSPYAHVRDGVKYPAVLVKTGINDPRVPAWLPAKLAARLQAATASGKPVLLRVDYDAGHGGFDATRRQKERVMQTSSALRCGRPAIRSFSRRSVKERIDETLFRSRAARCRRIHRTLGSDAQTRFARSARERRSFRDRLDGGQTRRRMALEASGRQHRLPRIDPASRHRVGAGRSRASQCARGARQNYHSRRHAQRRRGRNLHDRRRHGAVEEPCR